MPSSLDEVGVANLVLDHIVERPISALSDDTAYARWLNRNIAHLRDAFLQMHVWNFSIELATLTVDGTAPDHRWDYRYALPTGWLRLLPPRYLGEMDGAPIPHEIAKGYVMCNIPTELPIRYIDQITDYTTWDPLAIDAFALYLAYRMSMRFEAKATWRDRLKAEFAEAISLAVSLDAIQGDDDVVEQHTVLDVRDV